MNYTPDAERTLEAVSVGGIAAYHCHHHIYRLCCKIVHMITLLRKGSCNQAQILEISNMTWVHQVFQKTLPESQRILLSVLHCAHLNGMQPLLMLLIIKTVADERLC